MNDDLMERIQNYVFYYNHHRPNAEERLKNLMLEDMFGLLKEIVDLNNQE